MEGERQQQVCEVGAFVAGVQRRPYPTIVCGDFNAEPDSDEIRMVTGKSDPAGARAPIRLIRVLDHFDHLDAVASG